MSDLRTVAVEHLCRLFARKQPGADAPFSRLTPARMINFGIYVRVETIFVARCHRPAGIGHFFDKAHTYDALDTLEAVLPGGYEPNRRAVLIWQHLAVNSYGQYCQWIGGFGNRQTFAIRLIMIALAVTPLRRLSGWNWLSRFRRMLGLFAFFYVLMHFLTWLILDQGLLLSALAEDLTKRPFIMIGFAAFVLLTAMAATSPVAMRRRLGKRWQTLHNSVYVIGMLGVWHYWWQVKKDFTDPLIYAVILSVLLGLRIWWRHKKAHR